MAVHISGDSPPSEDELDAQFVAAAFVEQYYLLLQKSPKLVHKFYNDQSMIDRLGLDGEMVSVMTMEGINHEIMSSEYKGCLFMATNVDAQASLMGGVIVAVNGYFIGKDNLEKSFNQTFFLAKQAKGYFVLNDILRFLEVSEPEALPTSNGTKENASDVSFTHDQETPAQPKELIDGEEEVSDVESEEKVSDAKTGNKLSDIEAGDKLPDAETGKKASNIESGKKPSNIESGKNASKIESGNNASNIESEKNASDIDSGEKMVAEVKETKKTSYASMVAKEGKVVSPTNSTGYKIVRVAPDADQQPIAPARPRDPGTTANGAKKEIMESNVAAENNNSLADALAPKSIYIANLPRNITRNGLIDALKIFGRVKPNGIQIRTFEDGFCFGFVEFESASSASKAVEVHNVTVGGNEAYMMYKKSSGSRSGGPRSGKYKGQDTGENHTNGGYQDDNQEDIKNQAWRSGGYNGEINWKSQNRAVGTTHSKSKQPSDEWLPAREYYKKNNQTREERRRIEMILRRRTTGSSEVQ